MDDRLTKNNITEGGLFKTFIVFFIPILLGSIIQQSYSIIDALIVGNYAGKSALAAIDAPYAYIKLMINAFISLASGGAIVIGQLYGAKQFDDVKITIKKILIFSGVGGIIITVMGILLSPVFIDALLIPKDIYDLCLTYLRIYFSGTIFVLIFNMVSGILRALGDSKSPFQYLMLSSIINIILDLIFVGIFKKGVAGAAFATVIAQGICSILILLKLKKAGYIGGANRQGANHIHKAIKLGIPMAIQTILFAISNIFMQRGINSFGTDGIAGWSICGKSDFMVWAVADTLGIAVMTFVAQNYGAKKFIRVKGTLKIGLISATVTLSVLSILLYLFIGNIALLFTRDTNVINNSVMLMRMTAPFYLLYAYSEIFAGALRGKGNTFHPMIITLIGLCGTRIIWIQVIAGGTNLKNVIMGYPVSWIITALIFCVFYIVYTSKESRNK